MDLIAITRRELDRAMLAAGWKRMDADFYERPVTKPFALHAQFWIDGAPVELQSTLWIACEQADRALEDLGEEDLVVWVLRDPLDDTVTIERPDQVAAAIGDLMTRIARTAEQLGAYLSVDAFVEQLSSDPETSENAPKAVPVVLAVTGSTREARELARQVPGDFADRLDRWLAGERPPPPPGSEVTFSWTDALTAAIKARAVTPEERAQRPQPSWHDVWRTGQTLVRALHGELPSIPDRERAWDDVELNASAPPLLERARAASSTVILVDAFIQARLETGIQAGRGRVLIDGVDVGSLPTPDHITSTTVPGRLRRQRPGEPLTLAVQLPPEPADSERDVSAPRT